MENTLLADGVRICAVALAGGASQRR